jgi:hypothetical protein
VRVRTPPPGKTRGSRAQGTHWGRARALRAGREVVPQVRVFLKKTIKNLSTISHAHLLTMCRRGQAESSAGARARGGIITTIRERQSCRGRWKHHRLYHLDTKPSSRPMPRVSPGDRVPEQRRRSSGNRSASLKTPRVRSGTK